MFNSPEFVSVIHELVTTSTESAEALDTRIKDAFAGEIRMPVETAAAIASVLRLNAQMVRHLSEENHNILDHVEKILTRIGK